MSETLPPESKGKAPKSKSFEGPSSEGPESAGGSFKSPPAFSLGASPVQAKMGGNQSAPIQRAAADPITAPYVVEGREIWTYTELASWILSCKLRLQGLETQLTEDGIGIPASIPEAIVEAQDYYDLNEGGGSEIISEGIKEDSQAFARQFSRAMVAGNGAIAARASSDLREAKALFRAQQRDIEENVLPALREAQRSAFRSDDDDALLQIADTVMTAVDCGLTLETVILAIGEERAALEVIRNYSAGRAGLYVEANSRLPGIMKVISKINSGYAAFQLLRSGITLMSGSSTGIGGMIDGVNAMSTLYSAGGTLLGASAGITLYANLYLGPMVSACLTMIDRIADMRSQTYNRPMIAMGHYDSVNWLIEPGGREMFDYMLTVMHADSASDISAPTGDLEEYFLDQRGNFNDGIGEGKAEMPVDGLIWHDIKGAEFKRWVIRNRANIWGMLYGSMDVPRA